MDQFEDRDKREMMSSYSQCIAHSNGWFYEMIDNSALAKGSKKVYGTMMRKILRETNQENICDVVFHPKTHIKAILNPSTPLNTQVLMLCTIVSFLSYSNMKASHTHLYDTWYNVFNDLNNKKREITRSNIPTDKQTRGILEWNDVLKVRDQLVFGSMDHLLLSMYSYIPPRRQQDYASLRVYFDPHFDPPLDHNHFHVNNYTRGSAYLFLHEYKTKKTYGDYLETDIPHELVRIIIHSFRKKPRRYMFVTEQGLPFENVNHFQNYSNQILKRIFANSNVSVNSLRHSFATRLKSLENLSVHEHDTLARRMGHSLTMNLEYVHLPNPDHEG